MVKQFYENGADVNQKDESGDTPFMLAYKNGHKVENFLLEKWHPQTSLQNSY